MNSARFVGQEHYEELFPTAQGWIVVAAELETRGTTLSLTDIAIEPLDTRFLPVGLREVLSIRQSIETRAKAEGYTHIEVSGYRISGASPNRPINLRRSLT